jgi:hypothetical protein
MSMVSLDTGKMEGTIEWPEGAVPLNAAPPARTKSRPRSPESAAPGPSPTPSASSPRSRSRRPRPRSPPSPSSCKAGAAPAEEVPPRQSSQPTSLETPQLTSLPAEEKPKLSKHESKYDLDRDGKLDAVEVAIMKYDVNGDGHFSTAEVKAIINDLKAIEQHAKHFRNALSGAILAIVLLLIFTFGSAAAANEWSKEMHVDADGTVVSDDGSVLQTASKLTEMELTSRLPDKQLSQLTSFSYIDPNSDTTMRVTVTSFVRVPEHLAHCGSVVIMQTPLGMVLFLPCIISCRLQRGEGA